MFYYNTQNLSSFILILSFSLGCAASNDVRSYFSLMCLILGFWSGNIKALYLSYSYVGDWSDMIGWSNSSNLAKCTWRWQLSFRALPHYGADIFILKRIKTPRMNTVFSMNMDEDKITCCENCTARIICKTQ